MNIKPEPIRQLETDEKTPIRLAVNTCRVILRAHDTPNEYWLLKHEFVKQKKGVRRYALPLQSVSRYAFGMVSRVLKIYIENLPENKPVEFDYRCMLTFKSRGLRHNYHLVLVTVPEYIIKYMLEEEHIKPINLPPKAAPEKRTTLVLRSVFGWWVKKGTTQTAASAA